MVERAVRMQALRYHERGQKEKQTQDFENAVALYRAARRRVPRDASCNYELTFYLAEILFHRLGSTPRRPAHYLRAARKNPKGELTRDALYNAIVAFESVRVAELQAAARRAPAQNAEALPPECQRDRDRPQLLRGDRALHPALPERPRGRRASCSARAACTSSAGFYDPAVRQFGELGPNRDAEGAHARHKGQRVRRHSRSSPAAGASFNPGSAAEMPTLESSPLMRGSAVGDIFAGRYPCRRRKYRPHQGPSILGIRVREFPPPSLPETPRAEAWRVPARAWAGPVWWGRVGRPSTPGLVGQRARGRRPASLGARP